MRRFSNRAGRRAAGRVIVSASLRQQSSGAEGVVSVRTKGYGPSRDLVRGVQPHSEVVVETRLHPSDVEVQRSVLALTMPTIGKISVVNAPDHSKYRTNPLPPPMASARPAGEDSLAARDAALRVEMLEHSMEGQLTTMANLIMTQLRQSTGAQLAELEARQSTEGESLANMIVKCIRHELRRSGAAAAATAIVDSNGGTGARSVVDIEAITRHVGQQVASALQERMDKNAQQGKALEEKIGAYFANLQTAMRTSVTGNGLPAASDPLLAEDMRTAIVDAIHQAAQVQRESLVSVLEDLVSKHKAGTGSGGGGGGGSMDTKALEEFIEGSLRIATDDIRHAVSAEVKKVVGGKTSASSSGKAGGADSAVSAADVDELVERLDAAALSAKRSLNTVEAVQEGLTEVQEEQRRVAELLLSMKDLLERQLQAPEGSQATAGADAVAGTQVLAAVEELRQSIANLSATMEVNNENADRQLMDMAQAVSESVLAAVESRTAEALSSAVAAIESQVRHVMETQDLQRQISSSGSSEGVTTPDGDGATPPAASLAAMADMEARVTSVVEAVLAPKLEEALRRLEQSATLQPEGQVALAQSISDAVIAAIGSTTITTTTAAAATADNPDPHEARDDALHAKLDSLRTDLVATVEREMGKTHEVNLTPMYKYVDSVLTLLKEELSAQDSSVDKKINEAAAQLSALITQVSESQKQAAAQVGKLVTSEELEHVVSRISTAVADVVAQTAAAPPDEASSADTSSSAAAVAASAEANQSVVNALALASLETASTKMSEQLTTIQQSLEGLTGEQQVALKESIAKIIAGSEAHTRELKETLANVQATLKSQSEALEAWSPSARAERASSTAATLERVEELNRLRADTSRRVDAITTIMERVEKTESASERSRLVRDLRRELTAVEDLRRREESQFSSLVTPEALDAQAESATVAAPVRRELQRFTEQLQVQLRDTTASQAGVRQEILAAIKDLSGEVKASSAAAGEVSKLVESHVSALEKLLAGQQETAAQRIVQEVSTATAALMKETSTLQVSSVVEKVTERNESQLLAKITESFAQQTEAMRGAVSDAATRTAEAPMAPSNVDAVAAETARRVEQLLSHAEERSRLENASTRPPVARMPLWWLLANPIMTCLAVLLCAYFLFACFLVAFVPKPARDAPSADTPPATDSSAAAAAAVAASDRESRPATGGVAPPSPLSGSTGSGTVGRPSDLPGLSGRVVDLVL